jgi:polyisoprenoid-binding protein YceI
MKFASLGLALALTGLAAPALAQTFAIDNSHASVLFFAKHFGFSTTAGRFNTVGGEFTIDEKDASKSSVKLEIKVDSLETNDAKRNEHLRGPDFFDVKQFPSATFQSTAVKASGDNFDVTGDLTIKGVKKSVTLKLKRNATGEDPWKNVRTGFDGELVINRNDFGVNGLPPVVGPEIKLWLSIEGIKK